MIILLTTNMKKHREYEKIMGLYGLKIIQGDPELSAETFFEKNPDLDYVLRETSNLYVTENHKVSTKSKHLESVYNKSNLIIYFKNATTGQIQNKTYTHNISGYIDLEKRQDHKDVFDWDDIFVVTKTQMSYQEMYEKNIKVSARDLVLADFFRDFLHYKDPIDLCYNPIAQTDTIDFSLTASDAFKHIKYYDTNILKVHGLDSFIEKVINDGVFFRSAHNRREKNYWLPGLNAGIPLTPKKDSIHEATFMFHDLTHFLMPDLIFTGVTSQLHKNIYIAYRMLSEAITLVIADMVFVDSLAQSGVEYDYTKRKIYPLFQSLNVDLKNNFHADLKKILIANVNYALLGNEDVYVKMLKSHNTKPLEDFKEKYSHFFIEDYRWTLRNYNVLTSQKKLHENWVTLVGRKTFKDVGLPLLDEFVSELQQEYIFNSANMESIVLTVFEKMFKDYIEPCMLKQKSVYPMGSGLQTGFRRYMLGQLFLFARYPFIPGTHTMASKILSTLASSHEISLEQIKTLREFYNLYVDQLFNFHVITQDDAKIYKQMHPIFPPFYVFYDSENKNHKTINEAAQAAFMQGE
jgi:hypothetical protein